MSPLTHNAIRRALRNGDYELGPHQRAGLEEPWRRNFSPLLGVVAGGRKTASAGIALISERADGSANGNTFTTTAINTTGASIIIVGMVTYSASASPTFSDSEPGNSWSLSTAYTSENLRILFYYCASPITSASHTFTATGSSKYATLFPSAWSGTGASPLKFENGNGPGFGGTSLQPNSITPTNDGSLVLSLLGLNGAETPTINSSMTAMTNFSSTANAWGGRMAYLIQTPAAAINPTWSWTNTRQRVASIANFF